MFKTLYSQSVLKLFNYLISLLTIAFISKYLGLENLSTYFICLQLLLIISGICIYGFNLTSQKYLPILQNNEHESFKANSFFLTLFISLFVIISLYILLINLDYFSLFFSTKKYLLLFLLAIPAYSLIIFFTEIIRSNNKIILSQLITLIIYPILIILLLYFYYNNNDYFDDSHFFKTFFFSNIFLLVFLIIINKFNFYNFLKKVKLKKLKYQLKIQFLFFINNYTVLISVYIYTFIFNFYNLNKEIAYFNISIMLSSLIGLPLVFFINKYTRSFSINFNNGDKIENLKLFKNIRVISLYSGVLLYLFILVFYFFLSENIFSIDYKDNYILVTLTGLAFLINNYFGPNQIFLSIYNKQFLVFKILFLSTFLTFFIATLLIYYFGSVGACVSFIFYQLFINILLNHNLKKLLKHD